MSNFQFTRMITAGFLPLLFAVSCLLFVLEPTIVSAQGEFNLIVCDPAGDEPCTFAHLMELVRNLISALIILSTFLATGVFAYAGFRLLASGGSEGEKTKAKEIFLKVLKGYLWILGAWVLIYTITSTLLKDSFPSLLGS